MLITEEQLRQIVNEELVREDEIRRARMMADVEGEISHPETPGGSLHGFPFKDYSERRKEGRTAVERRLKKIWNRHADHEFFNKNLTKLHIIGLYSQDMGTCLDFMRAHAGRTNRDEISALGWRTAALTKGWCRHYGFIFGAFVKGGVTYAACEDQSTEWTSAATEVDRRRHAGSGLPKRPFFGSVQRVGDELVLDEEDWVNRIESPHRDSLHEIIVDNWLISSLAVNSRSVPGKMLRDGKWMQQPFMIELVDECRRRGLQVVDETGDPYDLGEED